jgi:hypothetical protein
MRTTPPAEQPDERTHVAAPGQRDLSLPGILLAGIALRLLFILIIDPHPSLAGGDVGWYLEVGRRIITNTQEDAVQSGPVYLFYAGLVQIIFPDDPVRALRLLNIGWHAALIVAVYALGMRYFASRLGAGPARLAAFAVAISPAFIIEAGTPLTESVFLGLMFGALAVYAGAGAHPAPGRMALVGFRFGLATLTRAVILLFPALIAIHLLRLRGWRGAARLIGVLALTYGMTVATWTAYNLLRWDRFIIGAEGLTAFAWMGATGFTDTQRIDAQLAQTEGFDADNRDPAFIRGISEAVIGDLPGWIRTRLTNLGEAYLQPHNTVYFPGESLKELAQDWLTRDGSLEGLIRLTSGDAFWPKLTLYIFHFWALLAGIAGMILHLRRDFWLPLPLYSYVVYTTAIHLLLLANPRYLFPLEPVFYLFAATASLGMWARLTQRTGNTNRVDTTIR